MNKKTKIISSIIILAIAIGATIFYFKKSHSSEVVYREIEITPSDLEITSLSTGTVQPENRLEIKPPIAGRVETVLAKEGEKVKKGQILAWMSSTERAALLDSARAKGPDELKRWEEMYRPTPILAPINGTIILRNVESGQTFTSSDYVFVMSDRLTVKAQVDETDISQIKVNQSAKIVLDAYPNQNFSAHVDQIAFDSKTVNNVTTYIVDVLPEKTPAAMRSGMTANVTFFITSKSSILTVPNEALKVNNNQFYVLIKGPNGKPQEQIVETGLSDGKKTEIINGLNAGDIILIAELKNLTSTKSSTSSNPFTPVGPRPPRRAGK